MYSSLTGSDFPYQRKLIFIAIPILEIHSSENHWGLETVAFAICARRRYDQAPTLCWNTMLLLPAKVFDFEFDNIAGLQIFGRLHAQADSGRRAG